MVDAVYREELWGNPEAIAQAVADKAPVLAAFHTLTMVAPWRWCCSPPACTADWPRPHRPARWRR